VVPLASIVHQPHEPVNSWSQDKGITCVGQLLCCGNSVLVDSIRYHFDVQTIMFAKEDSLLLPPEFMHDAERRCGRFRRHVPVSEIATFTYAWHGRLQLLVACSVSYDCVTVLVSCIEIVGTSSTAATCWAVCAATIASRTTGPKCDSPPHTLLFSSANHTVPSLDNLFLRWTNAASFTVHTLFSASCPEKRDNGRAFTVGRW